MKKPDYLCNSKSKINNFCNAVEGHCLQAMKIVHHHANGRFDWLISEQQSVTPPRETISGLPGKHKRFTFVHPVMPVVCSQTSCAVLSHASLIARVHGKVRSLSESSWLVQSITEQSY